MALVTLLDAHLAFGDRPLLDGAAFAVQANERIGLIGRNGTGKSTLLRIIAGRVQPDDGALQVRDGLRIGFVEQETELEPAPTIGESLAAGIPGDRWTFQARLNEYMDRLDLAPSRPLDTASGGERKRAALALAFALDPELLLLDEPTNHLDIAGIERLEELLRGARLRRHHPRPALSRSRGERIVELDRGGCACFPATSALRGGKNDELAAEELANRRFDKFWAQEEVWIRKGVEARRTRNEGRVKRLERPARRTGGATRARSGTIKLTVDAGERSGKLVAEFERRQQGFGGRADPRRSFAAHHARRSRRAHRPERRRQVHADPHHCGHARPGFRQRAARHERASSVLRPAARAARSRDRHSPTPSARDPTGSSSATQRQHVMSYLGDFLFSTQRAKAPIKMLSGGERNRLLLARLFARPANCRARRADERSRHRIARAAREMLQGYDGTLLLVSHDRRFLDNVVTQTLAAEGSGVWREYVGGYADWLRQRPAPASTPNERPRSQAPARRTKPRTKLSYKEERELSCSPPRDPGARARATRSHGPIEQRGASSQRRGASPSRHPARARHRAAARGEVRALGGARAACSPRLAPLLDPRSWANRVAPRRHRPCSGTRLGGSPFDLSGANAARGSSKRFAACPAALRRRKSRPVHFDRSGGISPRFAASSATRGLTHLRPARDRRASPSAVMPLVQLYEAATIERPRIPRLGRENRVVVFERLVVLA